MHPHRHLRPVRRGQGDLAVDPGRPTPSVALGHLPHADQRVRPGPQHHLLQRPDPGPVLLPRRLEDPAPQPRYVLLVGPPVDGVPVEHVLGSVHRVGVQLAPRFARPSASAFKGSPAHVSALSGPAAWTGIRPVPRDGRLEQRPSLSRVPLPFGHRHPLLGHPVPPGVSAPLTIGLPDPHGPDPDGVSTFRACETRPGWAPPIPRGQRCSRDRRGSPVAACRLFQRPGPITRSSSRRSGLAMTRHHRGFTRVRPSGLPLARSLPRTERGPLGFSPELRTPASRTRRAHVRGGDRSRTLIRNYAPGITGLQSASSLTARTSCRTDPFDLTRIQVRLRGVPAGIAIPHRSGRRACQGPTRDPTRAAGSNRDRLRPPARRDPPDPARRPRHRRQLRRPRQQHSRRQHRPTTSSPYSSTCHPRPLHRRTAHRRRVTS